MKKLLSMIIVMLFLFIGCSTVPKGYNFTKDGDSKRSTGEKWGYKIDQEIDGGLILTVMHYKYYFIDPDEENFQEVKVYFKEIANKIALERGVELEPIYGAMLNVTSQINALDGYGCVTVSGILKYKGGKVK